MHMGYLRPFSVHGQFGVIRCTCLKMACDLKATGHRVKWIGIWGLVVTCIWDAFNRLMLKVIWGSLPLSHNCL